ncbi:uncharacterized protein TRUGW13939_00474 [Talaromyces rugulosus]|uniref:Uncharacterized protein n=1 Tax=Talaromyces rugulosus TaxID=121627 RepID=A0A7H8QIW4_TALRU|nr:uncharacterized protein TRUGW13939_00474 [Talaromyces rugulosus]QKX53395.1 hypothetical protein TRUGW13939_00474 [Talaromyces rugulosus]
MLQENVGNQKENGTSDLASTSNRIATRFPFTVFLLSDRAAIGTVSSGLAIRGRADEEHVKKAVILTAVIRAQKKGTMSDVGTSKGFAAARPS